MKRSQYNSWLQVVHTFSLSNHLTERVWNLIYCFKSNEANSFKMWDITSISFLLKVWILFYWVQIMDGGVDFRLEDDSC